ncbi:uncharacterized protein NECHADRAFT_47693 [Fusarium vanettenii 77-13-4]|uniref:Zn(2)-C6 fungal-type domain-containing protein n=1 Tax=Fusarium vanettenii (strain ATCC MYA-4622 / CBS 123669 / FGSC 9596 / NRRL 45880 / 77-13-4) TaxID=660122 RepID=C7Z002_FUSV7|nr:uncharacterized protein NECHADRAFT_47693 [Fusarium vanettenii 77-13-4]EEU42702.1 hypothetical protein NECHADRAFT_47693 [Fusarium vanettenii 77-13-4]
MSTLRPLQPRQFGPEPPPPSQPSLSAPARSKINAACEACRKRKSRCSGLRPVCSRCEEKSIECVYKTASTETHSQALKRKFTQVQQNESQYAELYELLATLSEDEAEDVLRRIRSGAGVDSILSHIRAGGLLLQMALTPEARFRYEFPYISDMPEGLLSNNPYLDSLVYEAASLYPGPGNQSNAPRPQSLTLYTYKSPYLKPLHSAEVIDPLLLAAKPSTWTAVCANDTLMRELLNVYLRCEYLPHVVFQKDYFLEDMASGRGTFCSSLLVNALLAYTCICYSRFRDRAEYWNPQTLLYRFLAEAKRLWELEADIPRLTTVQAGVILNTVHNICGLDKFGRPYCIQALNLAHKLKLFDDNEEIQDQRTRDGRCFTAWVLYTYETFTAYHFMHPPALKQPPKVALPDPLKNARWYGEVWLKYPLETTLFPAHFGQFFKARCQFLQIMNAVCEVYFAEDGEPVTLEQANTFYTQFRNWSYGLPDCLKPRFIVHPGHFNLHFYHQNLIMTIYERFVLQPVSQSPSPQEMVSLATKHLLTLIRIYYLRHGFNETVVFICQPLALAAFMCLDAIDRQTPDFDLEATRSTLFLAAKGLRDQARSHYVAESLFQVVKGRMRPEELNLMRGIASIEDVHDTGARAPMQAVHSVWPVDITSKSDEIEANSLSSLVEQFAMTSPDA